MMKILLAASSLEKSDTTLAAGAHLAKATGSQLTVLHVTKEAAKRADAQAFVGRAVLCIQRETAPSDIQVEPKIRVGHPAVEIVNEAYHVDYDLIVIGTWPSHHLWHSLLAPTTERVLMQAPCPVLIVRGKLESLRNILLCVSGADDTCKAARLLASMVNHMTTDVTITILHVMSQLSVSFAGQQGWQLEAPAEKLIAADTPEGHWLSREVAILCQTNACVQPKVRHGAVVDEVLQETLDGDCDLLVIGAHRQAGWQRFLLDDLSHQIITRANRPVLVV